MLNRHSNVEPLSLDSNWKVGVVSLV